MLKPGRSELLDWEDLAGRRKKEGRCFLEYTKEDGSRGHYLWSPGFKLCEFSRNFDEHAERCLQVPSTDFLVSVSGDPRPAPDTIHGWRPHIDARRHPVNLVCPPRRCVVRVAKNF